MCDDGCSISSNYINDSYCDCSNCEDEPYYSCGSCFEGCPSECGNYTYCLFECYDGCILPTGYIDDGFCDCDECEDEPYFNCSSCLNGCTTGCGNYTFCYDIFTCDDGCEISSNYYDDYYCDCSNCEDESKWDCSTCAGGCFDTCGDYGYCVTNNNSLFECDDGCYILETFTDDSYCDCSTCEDEKDYDCDSCSGGCPSEGVCSEYTLCDADAAGLDLDDFLFDCETNSWQEIILMVLEGLLLMFNIGLVVYFNRKMKETYSTKKRSLMKKFKVLVTTSNVCYLVAMGLCIQKTYFVFVGWPWCHISIVSRVFIDIGYIFWEKTIYLAFIVVYITFASRFEQCTKGSKFESEKLSWFLRSMDVILVLVWIWTIIASILYYLPTWDSNYNNNDTQDGDKSVVDYEAITNFEANATNIMLGVYCLFSLIVLILFIRQFAQFIKFVVKMDATSNVQVDYTDTSRDRRGTYSTYTTNTTNSANRKDSTALYGIPPRSPSVNTPTARVPSLSPQTSRASGDPDPDLEPEDQEGTTKTMTMSPLSQTSPVGANSNSYVIPHSNTGSLTPAYANKGNNGNDGNMGSGNVNNSSGGSGGSSGGGVVPGETTIRTRNVNKKKQEKYNKYLSIVSRTALLSIIALFSTVFLIICVTIIWTSLFENNNYNPYMYEYIGIIYGIDSTINILCLNMNFKHGFDLYNKIGCKKLEDEGIKCVLFCFLCKIDQARFSTVRRARQHGRARDDSTALTLPNKAGEASRSTPQVSEIELCGDDDYNRANNNDNNNNNNNENKSDDNNLSRPQSQE